MPEENTENEKFRWFYQGKTENNKIMWDEYDQDTSELIECKYQEYLDNKEDADFQTYEIDKLGYEIDFLNRVQISLEDKSRQRSIGRFNGDPNIDQKLRNSIITIKYTWYFSANEENSTETILAPYRIADNNQIEKAFVDFSLCKGSNIYTGSIFCIDFEKMEETRISDGKTKKVYRMKECPNNITRVDYYNNEIKPTKTQSIVLDENSISSMKSNFQIQNIINYYEKYSLKGHKQCLLKLIKLSNGNIASCSDDKTIRIWDKNNNYNNIHTLHGHENTVKSLIELSDGNIASCSDDKTIILWDKNNNYNNIHTLLGHEDYVRCSRKRKPFAQNARAFLATMG